MIPAEIAINSEGTCAARPSPMVNIVYFETASAAGIPFNRTPIIKPPTMFMTVIIIPAMVSPLTNFIAPSIEPNKDDSL